MFSFRRKQENQNPEEKTKENVNTTGNTGEVPQDQTGVFGSFTATGGNYTNYASQQPNASEPSGTSQSNPMGTQTSGQSQQAAEAGAQPSGGAFGGMQNSAGQFANPMGAQASGQVGEQSQQSAGAGAQPSGGAFGGMQNSAGQFANPMGAQASGQVGGQSQQVAGAQPSGGAFGGTQSGAGQFANPMGAQASGQVGGQSQQAAGAQPSGGAFGGMQNSAGQFANPMGAQANGQVGGQSQQVAGAAAQPSGGAFGGMQNSAGQFANPMGAQASGQVGEQSQQVAGAAAQPSGGAFGENIINNSGGFHEQETSEMMFDKPDSVDFMSNNQNANSQEFGANSQPEFGNAQNAFAASSSPNMGEQNTANSGGNAQQFAGTHNINMQPNTEQNSQQIPNPTNVFDGQAANAAGQDINGMAQNLQQPQNGFGGEQGGGQPNGEPQAEDVAAVFNPEEYAVDIIYKPTGAKFYEVDISTLEDDAKNAMFVEAMNALKIAVINVNSLVSLVQKKNKKLQQFDDMTKAFEYQKTDFDNYKKRNKDLAEKAKEEGYFKVLTNMLPTIDNFERAIPMITDESVRAGVELILRQLQKTLGGLGVAEIDCLGKEFDPDFHNAILTGEAKSKEEEDTVMEVLQKGYTCGEKVLRYAQVRVAK